ncbi:hypothetical protein L1O48_08440 [Ligilactobacillus equi]|uniref:hypothetical protein n=1 Tax=Ligilactobacillus equi TaxID=137357 RepID=UPI002ED63AFC
MIDLKSKLSELTAFQIEEIMSGAIDLFCDKNGKPLMKVSEIQNKINGLDDYLICLWDSNSDDYDIDVVNSLNEDKKKQLKKLIIRVMDKLGYI